MRGTPTLRAQVAATARHMHEFGWVANHDGNVTARDGAGYVATPTATSKRLITDREIIQLDAKGKDAGASFVAIDHVQAGVGDKVIVVTEGNGVRQILGMGDIVPIRSIIVGVVDHVEIA